MNIEAVVLDRLEALLEFVRDEQSRKRRRVPEHKRGAFEAEVQDILQAVERARDEAAQRAVLRRIQAACSRAGVTLRAEREVHNLQDPGTVIHRGYDPARPGPSLQAQWWSVSRDLHRILRGQGTPGHESFTPPTVIPQSSDLTPIMASTTVHAPRQVQVGTRFSVQVGATLETSSGDAALTLTPGPDGTATVEVALRSHDPEVLKIVSAASGQVVLRADEEPLAVGFTVAAQAVGLGGLTITYRHAGECMATVARDVEVVVEAPQTSDPVLSSPGRIALAAGSVPPWILDIDIRDANPRGAYWAYRLHRQGEREVHATLRLPSDTETMLLDFSRQMVDFVARKTTADSRAAALPMQGRSLANLLLPPEIQSTLADLPKGTALVIEHTEAWAPWEMVNLKGVGFLGEHLALTRWLKKGLKHVVASTAPSVLVAPASVTDLDRDDERGALEAFGPAPEVLRTTAEVIARLDDGPPVGLLHVSTHGAYLEQDATKAMLQFDDGDAFSWADLPPPSVKDTTPGPLHAAVVMVNACEAGLSPAKWHSYCGFAVRFLDMGAAVVVTPNWSVADGVARRFATTFYDRWRGGETAGEAARQARVAAARYGDADHLAYACYAGSHVRRPDPKGPLR